MDDALRRSYDFCEGLSRRTAGNFYYAFLTLPSDRFRAMCVLYAFMRMTDDLGDSDEPAEARASRLFNWRESLNRACDAGECDHPLLPALADVIRRTGLPRNYLTDVITGVEMDLLPVEYATFDRLRHYCYHVAGAVGLACIHLWGYHDDRAPAAAIDCGTAFQLTNILRDVREDAGQGRVYLPKEHLERFGLAPDDLRRGPPDDARFQKLMQFEIDVAGEYYARAETLFDYLDAPGRPILETMVGIYGGLLKKIARAPERVLRERIALGRVRKLAIAGKALARHKLRNWFG